MTPEHAPASRHNGNITEVLLCPQEVHVTQGGVSMPRQTETHHIHFHVFTTAKTKKQKNTPIYLIYKQLISTLKNIMEFVTLLQLFLFMEITY